MSRRGGRVVLVFIFFCHAVSFLLFCRGFMLKRVVVPEHSTCTHTRNTHSCHSFPRPFKRVLWLLIDALRYDFTVYDETLDTPPVYRNKMPYIRDLLRSQPGNARLFKFVADPPTTTMQRLKALTTGSLPTFIDIGSNFNSYAVSEDSIPHQAKLNDRNVTFIGDDTWLGLYPDMLTTTYDYPSLNVKDLDTVDDGVMERLGPVLSAGDAEIVIGHMLGVDHVGHTYGPSHWTMGEKLMQMNHFIQRVFTDLLDEDTLVFVFGDHGMTSTGDHGGETDLETNAALLVYSPRPLFDPQEPPIGREVYQIDLVPTTAMAVGLPIPFSNLGMLIPEVLLPHSNNDVARSNGSSDGFSGRVTLEFLTGLRINAEQIHHYLSTYAQYSQDFPAETFRVLEGKFERVSLEHKKLGAAGGEVSQDELTYVAREYIAYMREVKAMCHSIWAKFDGLLMMQGLVLLALTVVTTPLMLLDIGKASLALHGSLHVGLVTGLVGTAVSASFAGVDKSPFGVVILLGNFALVFLMTTIFVFAWKFRDVVLQSALRVRLFRTLLLGVNLQCVLSVIVVLLHAVSMLSNSFVLYEADMLAFFIQSLVCGFALRTVRKELRSDGVSSTALLKSVLPHVILMACVRSSKLFYACRDLQIQDGCEATTFILSLASAWEFLGDNLSICRFLLSVLAVLSVPAAILVYLWRSVSHKSLNPSLLTACGLGFPVCVLCVLTHWLLEASHSLSLSLTHWQHVAAPRTVYAISAVIITLCLARPFKRLPPPSCEDPVHTYPEVKTDHTTSLPKAETNAESSWRRRKVPPDQQKYDVDQTNAVPTAARSLVVMVTVVILGALWCPAVMVLNDGIAMSAALSAIQMLLALKMFRSSEEGLTMEVCVLWGLLSAHSFFSLGHHATVTSLRFEAAFAGIHGEITRYNLPLAAVLVGLNTIASQVFFGLGFPLLLALGNGWNGCGLRPSQQLLPPMIWYSGLQAIKLLVTMTAAALHRRHLMVWWVFAPRFLYEGAFQATADVAMMIAFLLVTRFECAMGTRLQKQK